MLSQSGLTVEESRDFTVIPHHHSRAQTRGRWVVYRVMDHKNPKIRTRRRAGVDKGGKLTKLTIVNPSKGAGIQVAIADNAVHAEQLNSSLSSRDWTHKSAVTGTYVVPAGRENVWLIC
jgi:hypothetical protein